MRVDQFCKSVYLLCFVPDQNSAEPGLVLNPQKIKGYSVNVSYLAGEHTVSQAWSSDNYFSTTGLEIHLVSRSSKYIYIYFVPTTMFTLTSWVSFLIPPTSYPARTTLLVTVFLCQIGIFTTAIQDTPQFDGGR